MNSWCGTGIRPPVIGHGQNNIGPLCHGRARFLKPGIQCQAITKLQRFAINPGGQDFTRLLAISPPFKKDYFILDRCMRELEIEFGYGRANGPYITLDTKEGPKIIRMSRAERRELGLLKEDGARISERARRAEINIGDDHSFQSWASKELAQELKKVLQQPGVTWQDAHHCLAQHGVSIQPKGSGMIVTTTKPQPRPSKGAIGSLTFH
ncbi:MAG: hypothetical protein WJ306_01355 [Ferrovum myxofaciens]